MSEGFIARPDSSENLYKKMRELISIQMTYEFKGTFIPFIATRQKVFFIKSIKNSKK